MDKIEGVGSKEPLRLGVVYHKLDVRRHPARLYRAQVYADNFSPWVLIAHC